MEPINKLNLVCLLSDRILVTVNYEENPAVITKTARENQMLEEIKRVLRKCDRKYQGKFHLFFSTPRRHNICFEKPGWEKTHETSTHK